VLPPGELNSMITVPLPIYAESFITVSPYCFNGNNRNKHRWPKTNTPPRRGKWWVIDWGIVRS